VTIRLGLKHVFLLPSQICHLSRKREAGRPFRLRPTLIVDVGVEKREGCDAHMNESWHTQERYTIPSSYVSMYVANIDTDEKGIVSSLRVT